MKKNRTPRAIKPNPERPNYYWAGEIEWVVLELKEDGLYGV